MPGAHPQGLAAASPVEQVVTRDDADQARSIQIYPGTGGCRLDRPAMIQEYCAGGEYHEQRGQKYAVVQQRGQTATESGARAAGHDVGAGRSFFFGVGTGEATGFGPAALDDTALLAALGGGAFGTSNCSRGRKM